MKTNIDGLKPKHGQELIIDCNKAKVKDALRKLTNLQNEAALYLTMINLLRVDNKMIIPCKQCWIDTAIQFEEIGSLIRELADDK